MAVVKHMAMNMIRQPKDKHSLKNRRKLACLDGNYLQSLIHKQPLTRSDSPGPRAEDGRSIPFWRWDKIR
jgi:hypothetical protein